MASIEQLLSRGTPTARLRVPLDGGAAQAATSEARAELARARLAGGDVAAAREALEAAEEAEDGATATIVMRGLSRGEYRRLEDAHPPTDEQVEAARDRGERQPAFNDETFPPALFAACVTDPEMTEEQAAELWESWSSGDLLTLFTTATRLCMQSQIGLAGKA